MLSNVLTIANVIKGELIAHKYFYDKEPFAHRNRLLSNCNVTLSVVQALLLRRSAVILTLSEKFSWSPWSITVKIGWVRLYSKVFLAVNYSGKAKPIPLLEGAFLLFWRSSPVASVTWKIERCFANVFEAISGHLLWFFNIVRQVLTICLNFYGCENKVSYVSHRLYIQLYFRCFGLEPFH